MSDEKVIALIRAKIAMQEIPKKSLARKCKITRPQFSEILHGDRPMPEDVKARLIGELDLEQSLKKIGLWEETNV